MFNNAGPRLFALPPGADFPAALIAGLRDRLQDHPPEAMARVTVLVNTQRMRRRITELFTLTGAGFLPRIRLITELGQDTLAAIPPAVSPLRRRLDLAQLIAALLDREPGLAPRSALFDLAESLAALMDEMQGEGVSPQAVSLLDVGDHSGHWERSQRFLGIVARVFDGSAPDAEARQRLVVEALIAAWAKTPPQDPVIVAGSTGSRGTTALLMQGVAQLPQGAVVLPGFDFQMAPAVWANLDDALTAEDHPQYRFHRFVNALGMAPDQVQKWTDCAENVARNRLISLSLRPAPVTDQWLTEGRKLADLAAATSDMTLIEAPDSRSEALAIALMLRSVADSGRTAALITPDRGLTRQVTAALDRWGIIPDDSAGRPLALSAPGRLLRHVAGAQEQPLTSELLLTLLKHPLTATGADRGTHLRLTRDLELHLRRHGPPFPTGMMLQNWAILRDDPAAFGWAEWLSQTISPLTDAGTETLSTHVERHLKVTEALATGPQGISTGELWRTAAGEAALSAMQSLLREAQCGGTFSPGDYRNLLDSVLAQGEVREDVQSHPRILIWGTLEARVQGADLVILGGLNDGIWPGLPPPDPWLNRQMRLKAGLLLPERRIGLSAHDYQQAVGATEVVLTRARRNADAETVASRWLNRLTNLLEGLPDQGGRAALAGMRDRGAHWIALATALEQPRGAPIAASRPAPRPPVEARPKELAVTRIGTLIRDPYEIYARYVLRLKKLSPLQPTPDAMLRGSVLHLILEQFVLTRPEGETADLARKRLLDISAQCLAAEVPWPSARALWLARLDRAADFFLAQEQVLPGTPVVIETIAGIDLTHAIFRLTARPDRIDLLPDGRVHIIDYKTGKPPTESQQKQYDNQLLLQAAMAERGAFEALGPRTVARISYIGLGTTPAVESTDMTPDRSSDIWERLHKLIAHYNTHANGYTARRAVFVTNFAGDYDHLSRFGEWDMSVAPTPEDVG